jgi:hypothetical protein
MAAIAAALATGLILIAGTVSNLYVFKHIYLNS